METKEDIKIREILEKEEVLQKRKKKIEPQFGLGQVPNYGKSRPSDDTYRKRWNEIFGKREKTLHEELMEGFEKEQKELNESYEQSKRNRSERSNDE